jgi:alpha-1,2-mannosyltransferase
VSILASRDTRVLATWFMAAVVLVTLLIALQQQYRAGGQILFNDFDRWMIMTPGFIHGPGSYVDDLLPTPPVSLLVLGPFSMLPRGVAQFLWVCLKLPFAWLVLVLSAGIVGRAGIKLTPVALALIVACWCLPVVVDMQEGQVNFLALLPLVAGLYIAQGETTATDIAAGLLIGLGAAVKVTPVVFIVYFLWKRRWRIALSGLAGLAAWSLLLPALFFGWNQNLLWLGQWMRVMIVPYAVAGKVVYSNTQSIGSFALRLLSEQPAFEIHREGVFETGYMNLAALSLATVQQIVRILMLAVGVAGLMWSRHALPTLRCQRYVLEVGAVAAFMLWFSERTWVHHYISFVLTLSAAGMVLSDPAVPEPRRILLQRLLVLFVAASFFASDAGRVFGPRGVEWAKAVGVFLWPSVLVTMAALGAAMRGSRSRAVGGIGWPEGHTLTAAPSSRV